MGNLYLIVFNNTHEAITAESKLKEMAISNIVMPTPTDITKSCGICLRIKEEELEEIKTLIAKEYFKVKNICYKVDGKYNCIL